ncbi:MAG: tetratricopeptide repeat protein, partial [Candidatus Omnitrophica bacterium]|nr:tetratricopeptide repeat protein [Candidatus Omnitrophota bacterium]
MQAKLSIIQKTILILFGIFLSIIILEIGLRFGGFIFLSMQEYRNIHSLNQKSTCRILCLGESTTALGGEYSYPSQLERILNSANTGIKFSVINKGIPGIHTSGILENLTDNLEKYNPDIVITMIGINDQVVYLQDQNLKIIPEKKDFFRELKIWKLGYFIWLHSKAKINELRIHKKENKKDNSLSFNFVFGLTDLYAEDKNSLQPDQINYDEHVNLGWLYTNQKKFVQAEEEFKKALEMNSQCDNAYFGLGTCYARQERFAEARALLRKALEANPKNYRVYIELGGCSNCEAKHGQAEEEFKKALEINPQAEDAYRGLGWTYELQKKYPQAEEAFSKALEINPDNYYNCVDFGLLCSLKGRYSQAEKLLKKALELRPGDEQVYANLGWCYKLEKKYPQAEEAFKKALEINSRNDKALGGLAELCQERGQFEFANEYRQK